MGGVSLINGHIDGMTIERKQLSVQTVKDNIAILESQEPQDAGYYLQLEHERFVLSALEKQIPKKPNIPWDTQRPQCPICQRGFLGEPKYCEECGQALDWSE